MNNTPMKIVTNDAETKAVAILIKIICIKYGASMENPSTTNNIPIKKKLFCLWPLIIEII